MVGEYKFIKIGAHPVFPRGTFFTQLQEKRGTWWVMLADPKANRIIAANHVRDLVTSKKVFIKFAAPPNKGTWKFKVIVKSDSSIGCDVSVEEMSVC